MNETPCLCKTSAALYCPEHEMDGPELRGRAYVELAHLYLSAIQPTDWPCDVRFDGPFGKSKCVSCGREWEAMTPKGSERHCVREIGTMLAAANKRIAAMEQELMDHAEDWAMAGIPARSDLAVKLSRHYQQRVKDREDAAKWRAQEGAQ